MGYIISKEIEFDAGHRVPLHESKCKNPHGHRYKVVATIEGELITKGPETGMVRDFSIIKELLTEHVHDVYDHGFIVHERDFDLRWLLTDITTGEPVYGWKVIVVPFVPTAECLARSIFDTLREKGLPNLIRIDVYETPTSVASYSR